VKSGKMTGDCMKNWANGLHGRGSVTEDGAWVCEQMHNAPSGRPAKRMSNLLRPGRDRCAKRDRCDLPLCLGESCDFFQPKGRD